MCDISLGEVFRENVSSFETDRIISICVTSPKVARQVRKAISHYDMSNVFANKFCQCTRTFSEDCDNLGLVRFGQ
jgi:hypothetical protein